MWKPPPVPMDVYGAVSKLKNVDVLQNVQKAKGIWAEAFELGGEKSEVEAALAEWNENLHDLADLDDQEAAALMPAGGREAAAAAAAPMIDSSYLTMASISPLDGKPPQQRRGSMPGAVESRLGMCDGDSPPASPVHAPAPAPESVSLLVSDSYHGSTAAEEATEAVLAAERELDLVTKMGAEEQLQSDEQASVYDKIIHMQREKLKQLQREKARAESEAQQAHAAATTAQRRHISEANRRPNANGMPLSSPEEILAAGKGVAAVVIPVMRTRRGMAGLGMFFAVLFLYYVTQKGVDSRDVEVAGDSAKGHATERLVEKAELEQLVVALLQDQKALVNGAEKKDSETMERHIDTVSKLLMKMHQDHMRSQDKVHDKLSRENDKLVGELERLNAQVKGALEQPTSLGASPPPPAPGAAPLPPPEAPPAAAATPPPAPGGAPPPAAAAEPPPAPGAAPPPPVAA